MSPAVLCLKDVDLALVKNSVPDIENVMSEGYKVPPSDVQFQNLQETDDKSIFINYTKPSVIPIAPAMLDIAEKLKSQPGFENAEILDAGKLFYFR